MSLTISLTFVKDQPKKVYGLTNPKGPKLMLIHKRNRIYVQWSINQSQYFTMSSLFSRVRLSKRKEKNRTRKVTKQFKNFFHG